MLPVDTMNMQQTSHGPSDIGPDRITHGYTHKKSEPHEGPSVVKQNGFFVRTPQYLLDCGLEPRRTEATAWVICSVRETETLQKPDPLRIHVLCAFCPSFAGRRWCSSANDESQEALFPSSGRNHQRGIMLHQPLPVLNCRKLPVHHASSPSRSASEIPLVLRPPGQKSNPQTRPEITTEKSTFVYEMSSSKRKEIETKMKRACGVP
jgi:hypothetical protein